MPQPVAVIDEAAAERQPEQRIGPARADLAGDLLEQRPRLRVAPDQHLPARLDVQARVEQERRVALDAGVGQGARILAATAAPSRTRTR